MFAKIERWLTFGNYYVAASVVYLGLALILGGSTFFDSWKALAQNPNVVQCTHDVESWDEENHCWVTNTFVGCPEETQSCCLTYAYDEDSQSFKAVSAACMPANHICCQDGTHGDMDTCTCAYCDECSLDLTTIKCDDEEDDGGDGGGGDDE